MSRDLACESSNDTPPTLVLATAADADASWAEVFDISAACSQTLTPPPSLTLNLDDIGPCSPPPLNVGEHTDVVLTYDGEHQQRGGLAEIVDGVLLLGPYRDTVDAAECARLGVGAFLCVAAECGPPPHAVASGAPTLHLRLVDEPRERLAEHIPAACAFIDAQAAAGRRTAIFCRKGRSRSVALCAAYVRHRGLAACGPSALEYVAGRYPRGDPNFWFLQQLGAVPERGFPSPAISADSI